MTFDSEPGDISLTSCSPNSLSSVIHPDVPRVRRESARTEGVYESWRFRQVNLGWVTHLYSELSRNLTHRFKAKEKDRKLRQEFQNFILLWVTFWEESREKSVLFSKNQCLNTCYKTGTLAKVDLIAYFTPEINKSCLPPPPTDFSSNVAFITAADLQCEGDGESFKVVSIQTSTFAANNLCPEMSCSKSSFAFFPSLLLAYFFFVSSKTNMERSKKKNYHQCYRTSV